ncbi:cohesin loading factor Ssl3 [Ancistrocladus abbreviatus]
MKVGPEGGLATLLTNEAEGVPLGFTNDLDIDDEGNIYFIHTSTRYQRRNFMQMILFGEDSGRLLKYNPLTKETTILVNNIQLANGVAVSKDGSFVLFCEGSPGRLSRFWLKGEKVGTSDVFAILPGYPTNVRRNEKGEFWVAINFRRNMYAYMLAMHPKLRDFVLRLPIPMIYQYLLYIGGDSMGWWSSIVQTVGYFKYWRTHKGRWLEDWVKLWRMMERFGWGAS